MKKLLVLLAMALVLFCACDDSGIGEAPKLNSFVCSTVEYGTVHQDSFTKGDRIYMQIEFSDSDKDAGRLLVSFVGPDPIIPAVNEYPIENQTAETETMNFWVDTDKLPVGEYTFEAVVEDSFGSRSNTIKRIIEIN